MMTHNKSFIFCYFYCIQFKELSFFVFASPLKFLVLKKIKYFASNVYSYVNFEPEILPFIYAHGFPISNRLLFQKSS